MADNYISIDLNDPRMKHLSEILGNESCKKILNLLAENEWTETEIARELKMPLNSVDYNIKKLVNAGLIESSSHWWSAKGKKMPSYKVSNKKIIISPRRMGSSFIIPAIMTGVVAILGIRKLMGSTTEIQLTQGFVQAPSLDVAVNEISTKSAASFASDSVVRALNDGANSSIVSSVQNSGFFSSLAGWEWMIMGVWAASVLFLVLSYVFERRRKYG
jgi:DNA-binding transcriptional ArsR family regulator